MNERNGFILVMKYLAAFMLTITISTGHGQEKLTAFVDPFIGTKNMGHTYPGATVPFGMIQLSPDTDIQPYSYGDGYNKDAYRYCAGYQYDDNTITGFSHTHFSGTGHSDLGDFLIMPTTGEIKTKPGTKEDPDSGYRSRFNHEREYASPGYYSVFLDDYDIMAELTATERVGFHRYIFPETGPANIILDMDAGIYNYPGKLIWAFLRVENDTLVTGFRQTRGWARTRYIYFAMVFSEPIREYGYESDEKIIYRGFYRKFDEKDNFPEMAGRDIRAFFRFDTQTRDTLKIKFAISAVSTQGALENLQEEIPHWDFERTREEARDKWEEELDRIRIEGSPDMKTCFYTAMYHAFLSPTLYLDSDGQYRGVDQNDHHAPGFTNYSTFSLWDTYRALHPLFTIIQQQRTSDILQSMLAHQQQSVHKILPIWSHHANENWCMIGYHAVSVIADAWLKGIHPFRADSALSAMVASATYPVYDGIGSYMQYGFVPADLNSNSASKTLEYAYDDYCIGQMAAEAGNKEISETFRERSQSFKKVFDPSTGFMRARNSDGSWLSPFDPMKTEGQGFIEGNAWNYSYYVPQDPAWLIIKAGGKERFIEHLDSLFSMPLDEASYEASEDIQGAGIIGNYVHGNEPSHHVPYLYDYAGAAWKTQERVRQVVNDLYRPRPDGLPGNDDCGQMSAWYIFSCLGFYPVCPGSNEYVIGSPCVEKAVLNLENGNQFTIIVRDLSEKQPYIKRMFLNGKEYDKLFIRHEDIMKGGELIFEMSAKPNKKLGSQPGGKPYSSSLSL